jgi:hypothetical protein
MTGFGPLWFAIGHLVSFPSKTGGFKWVTEKVAVLRFLKNAARQNYFVTRGYNK